MSRKDRDRLKVLHEVRKRHITQVQAGKELAISPRWVRELLRRMKARGDRAVVHGLRGKRSNRRLPEAMKARAVKLFAQQKQARQWHDYGPTLAAEELAEHGVQVGEREVAKVAAAGRTVEGAAGPGGASAHVAPATSALGRAAAVGHYLGARPSFPTAPSCEHCFHCSQQFGKSASRTNLIRMTRTTYEKHL